MRKWSLLFVAAASVSSVGALDVVLPNAATSLKFAVIGDYGTGDRPSYETAAQMAALRARFPFELVPVLAAALIGRPSGILASVALALAAGLRPPAHLQWRELIVVSLTASAGFTFALFFATSIMPPGPLLSELKLGALSTVAGAFVAMAAARLLHVARFRRC